MKTITLKETKLPSSYRKMAEITFIPGEGEWITVASFASTTSGQGTAYFLYRHRGNGTTEEITEQVFSRLVSEYLNNRNPFPVGAFGGGTKNADAWDKFSKNANEAPEQTKADWEDFFGVNKRRVLDILERAEIASAWSAAKHVDGRETARDIRWLINLLQND